MGWLNVRLAAVAASAVLLATVCTGQAETITPPAAIDRSAPMRIALVQDAAAGCAPTCAEWIAAVGRIVPGTAAKFDRVLRQIGKRRPPVFIDSLGGSVTDAMAMGRQIRERGLDVVVTRTIIEAARGTPEGLRSVCASACVLVLAAGVKREVAPWAFVGIHQLILNETLTRTQRLYRVLFRNENGHRVVLSRTLVSEHPVSRTSFTAAPSQRVYDQVASYLARLGIGATLLPLMRETPPTGIHWMTAAEEKSTAIATDSVDGNYIAGQIEVASMAKPPATHMSALPEPSDLFTFSDKSGSKAMEAMGRVTWSLDRDTTTPSRAILRADIDIPDAKLKASMRMQRSPGSPEPASERMTFDFKLDPAAPLPSIEAMGLPQMRDFVPPQRYILVGTVKRIGPTSFEADLTDNETKSLVNQGMIEARPWFDLPLAGGGKSAVLTFEHGAASQPLIEQAFRDWAAPDAEPPAPVAQPKS